MTFIVSLVALAVAAFVLVAVLGLTSIFLGASASRPATPADINEGDFYSGPEGYTPNTAYPETYYGSAGQNDRDEEGPWNN